MLALGPAGSKATLHLPAEDFGTMLPSSPATMDGMHFRFADYGIPVRQSD